MEGQDRPTGLVCAFAVEYGGREAREATGLWPEHWRDGAGILQEAKIHRKL